MPSAKAELPALHQIGGPIRCRGRLESITFLLPAEDVRAHLAAAAESEFRLPRGWRRCVETRRKLVSSSAGASGWWTRSTSASCPPTPYGEGQASRTGRPAAPGVRVLCPANIGRPHCLGGRPSPRPDLPDFADSRGRKTLSLEIAEAHPARSALHGVVEPTCAQ